MPPTYRNPGPVTFEAVIQRTDGGGAFVEFPGDVETLFGVKGRVPVTVTFDGLPYRGSMVRMGRPGHLLLILKEIRERLGKNEGDRIRVVVALDDKPRIVELSKDVASAFRRGGVLTAYRKMSFSHQRESALWIEEAKQTKTRKRRIDRAVEKLKG